MISLRYLFSARSVALQPIGTLSMLYRKEAAPAAAGKADAPEKKSKEAKKAEAKADKKGGAKKKVPMRRQLMENKDAWLTKILEVEGIKKEDIPAATPEMLEWLKPDPSVSELTPRDRRFFKLLRRQKIKEANAARARGDF